MSFKQLLVVLLLGGAATTAYRSFNDPAKAGNEVTRTGTAAAATAPSRSAPAPGAGSRAGAAPAGAAARGANAAPVRPAVAPAGTLRRTVGTAGSWMVGGRVTAMTAKTERMLDELLPTVALTSGSSRLQAQALVKQIRTLDGDALLSLEEGRPIRAVRAAMKSRNLITDVRNHVLEQSIR